MVMTASPPPTEISSPAFWTNTAFDARRKERVEADAAGVAP
jgi:hypothetical protein